MKMSWLENRRSLKQLLKNWIKLLLRCQDTKPRLRVLLNPGHSTRSLEEDIDDNLLLLR